MTLVPPSIVLFDMDGTTVRHINPRLLHCLEKIDDFSWQTGKLISSIFRRRIKAPPLVEWHDGKRRKLLVHHALHKIRRREVEEIVEPCPGIYAVLGFLRDMKIPTGLVSNGLGQGYGHDILERFELSAFFDVTLFREDIGRSKPNPDPILKAVSLLPRPPEAHDVLWYVGDRNKDILAALAARAHLPCAVHPVAYGLHAAITALEKNVGPDHIFMSHHDLEKRLRGLFALSMGDHI